MNRDCWIAIKAALIVFKLMLGSTAFGQYVNIKADTQTCTPLGCVVANAMGSAVCIGVDKAGRAIHLTAGHCLNNARRLYSGVNGEWRLVTVLGSTGGDTAVWTPDMAIYAAKDVKIKNALPLAERPPVPGDDVFLHSFRHGDGRQYRARAAKVVSINEQYMVLSVPSEDGDSGGAVIHNGRLVGIISATGRNTTTATVLGQIRAFVHRTLGAIPDCGGPVQSIPPVEALPSVPPEQQPQPTPMTGPAGPQGPPGPAGKDADTSTLRAELSDLRLQVKTLQNTLKTLSGEVVIKVEPEQKP